ncbi:MAG: hypothetical protein QM489_00395 [Candidatus Izemoplasma sp.]
MKKNSNRLNYGCFEFPYNGLSDDKLFDSIIEWLDFKEECYNDNLNRKTTTMYGLSKRFRYGCASRDMLDCYPEYIVQISTDGGFSIQLKPKIIK